MSEPEERDPLNGGAAVEGTHSEGAADAGHNLPGTSDLSETGVGLSMGEPNTFEPEEAGPAVEGPTE